MNIIRVQNRKPLQKQAAAITEEMWNAYDDFEKRTKARNNLSKLIEARIGLGLDDLPDTSAIQIDNWWSEEMTLQETKEAIQEAYQEICSSLEAEGINSRFF